MAKRALSHQGGDTSTKTASVRPRLAQLTESDTSKDEPVHERAEDPKSSTKKDPVDQTAKADVATRLSVPTIVGQELAAAQAVTMQTPQPSSDKRRPRPATNDPQQGSATFRASPTRRRRRQMSRGPPQRHRPSRRRLSRVPRRMLRAAPAAGRCDATGDAGG